MTDANHSKQADAIPALDVPAGSARCCFNCLHWAGKRRHQKAYCYRLNLGGYHAPSADSCCFLHESKKPNDPVIHAEKQP